MKKDSGQTVLGVLGLVLGGIVIIAIVVGLAFGGRELGWWLKADNTNRQAHIDQNNFNRQNSLAQQIEKSVADIRQDDVQLADPSISQEMKVAIAASRKAEVNQMCELNNTLTGSVPLSNNTQLVVSKECS